MSVLSTEYDYQTKELIMAHIAYLTINGETQGLISSGCNTQDSMGNKCQMSHVDEISVLSCNHDMHKTPGASGKMNSPMEFTKYIDKASPLIASAFANQESVDCVVNFYRTNERGGNENFYTIELKKGLITGCHFSQPHTINLHSEDMHESISITYKEIIWRHNIAGTEGYDIYHSAGSE